MSNCDFAENGSGVVPGPRLQHNLLITRSSDISIADSRLDTSPYGSGVALMHSSDARITRCEIARNAWYGILVSESRKIEVEGNFLEGNDRSGVMVEFLDEGSSGITITRNVIQYNDGYAIESYAASKCTASANIYTGNHAGEEKISSDKFIVMR